jgi:A/G-specific adenine glycosylase
VPSIAENARALQKLRRALLGWFRSEARELPWRRTRDPYAIWVSEIMLQQTRVAVVVDYFARFMQRWPNVASLARARESSVLAAWSGLGYYRRARALHAAARRILRERNGVLPVAAVDWRELNGIGRYTANAIASQAHGEPCAVVDGNVERVLGRLTGGVLRGEAAWRAADELLDRRASGDWNQAMMELGATVCTPAQPACPRCPVARWCATSRERAKPATGGGRVAPAARRKRSASYALALRGDAVLLAQRPAGAALMPGMWELPEIQRTPAVKADFRLRHSITNTDYDVGIFRVALRGPDAKTQASTARLGHPNKTWFSRTQVERLPLTGLARKALRRAGMLD